jgi:PAS domain S-box-containing protein
MNSNSEPQPPARPASGTSFTHADAVTVATGGDRFFDSIFMFSPFGIGIAGPDMRYLRVNPALCRMVGYSEAELVGMSFMEITHPDDIALNARKIGELASSRVGHFAIEKRYIKKNGDIVWVSLNVVPTQQIDAQHWITVGLAEDITARRQTQMALAESESRFRNLIESTNDWVWEVDASLRYTYASPQVEQLLGYAPEEVLGKSPLDFMAPDEAVRIAGEMGLLTANRRPIIGLRNVNRHRDGHAVVLETSGTAIIDGAGNFLGYRGIDRDIGWREAMVQSLLASELKYRSLLKHAADAVVLADMKGTLLEMNDAAESLLGYSRDEIVGANVGVFHPQEEMASVAASFADLARTETITVRDVHVLTRQGKKVPIEINATLIDVGNQKIAQGIFHDVSALKQREAAHRDTLVREVHHRIKNNLQGVTGILRGLVQRQPAVATALEEAISQIGSISLVHGIYGRTAGAQVSLAELVNDVTLAATSFWNTEIAMDLDHAVERCIIDENEAVPLALVLNELLANACKHGDPHGPRSVTIDYAGDYAKAWVRIRNAGRLPPGFDFENGHNLGTGLGLVEALLPKRDARLEFSHKHGVVEAMLSLTKPLFEIDADPPVEGGLP